MSAHLSVYNSDPQPFVIRELSLYTGVYGDRHVIIQIIQINCYKLDVCINNLRSKYNLELSKEQRVSTVLCGRLKPVGDRLKTVPRSTARGL